MIDLNNKKNKSILAGKINSVFSFFVFFVVYSLVFYDLGLVEQIFLSCFVLAASIYVFFDSLKRRAISFFSFSFFKKYHRFKLGCFGIYRNNLKGRFLPRRRPDFEPGKAGAEAAKLKKFSDAGGLKSGGCPTLAKTHLSGCFGISVPFRKKFKSDLLRYICGCYFLFLFAFAAVQLSLFSQLKRIALSLSLPKMSLDGLFRGADLSQVILFIYFLGFAGACLWMSAGFFAEKAKQYRNFACRTFLYGYFLFLIAFSVFDFRLFSKLKVISNSTFSFWNSEFITSFFTLPAALYQNNWDAILRMVLMAALLSVIRLWWKKEGTPSVKSARIFFLKSFCSIYVLFIAAFFSSHFLFLSQIKERALSVFPLFAFPDASFEWSLRAKGGLKGIFIVFVLGCAGVFLVSAAQYLIGKINRFSQLFFPIRFGSIFLQKSEKLSSPNGTSYFGRRSKRLFRFCLMALSCSGIFAVYSLCDLKPFTYPLSAVKKMAVRDVAVVEVDQVKAEPMIGAKSKPTSALSAVVGSIMQFSNPPLPIEPAYVAPAVEPLALSFARSAPPQEARKKTRFPIPKRMMLSHNEGFGEDSGIGFGTDYSTLGIFLAPDYGAGSFYPLIDLRGHRFDNDTYAANVGIGCRYIPTSNSFCEIIGLNLFYDWRQGFLNQYNQFGVGLEVLGRRWDFRANGYFPVGAKTFQYTCVFDDYIGDYYIINQRKEVTSYGFNAEVGWLAVASENFLLYFAAGPYYLTRKSSCFDFEPIRGGKVRARPQYKDYFAVDVSYSYDTVFESIWETVFIVSLPLYQITNQNERPCRLTDRQIYQPIERLDTMSLGTRSCWSQNF